MGHDNLHKAEHESGGDDEIVPANLGTHGVAELDGAGQVVADPKDHATTHEDGGTDKMEIASMATTEVTTTKVLKPDGAGGISWQADAISTDISCSAYRNVVQSVPQNAWTAVQLNAEDFDTDTMHDVAVANTKIIIPAGKGGKYLIGGMVTFASNANKLRGIAIQKNGVPGVGVTLIQQKYNPVGAQESGVEISKVVELTALDEIEVYAYQSTAANLDTVAGSDKTFLQVIAQRGVS